MNKRIIFLLPGGSFSPIGGYKIVFEYANKFSNDGYSVYVIYPSYLATENLNLTRKIKRTFFFVKSSILKTYSCKWFKLETDIKEVWILKFNDRIFKKDDIVIATAAETALFLMNSKKINLIIPFYFIQDYENWNMKDDLLISTWKANLHKIVIAPWLYDIAAKYDQEAELIENGFDFDYFKLMKNIEDRSPFIVSMLFNDMEKKGCKYAFQALKTVKNKIPQLKCLIFGVNDRPSYLPDWYEYYKMPDKTTHNMIYNTASIFIAPALIEGHGLTQAEAMQCGCAVIATNIGGYRVNCINNKTALLCEPANSLMMADLIIKLIEDNDLRMTLAKNGYEYIKQFTWERAYKKFKSFIENNS